MTARTLMTAVCVAGLMASAATPSLAAARKAAPAPVAKTTPKIEWVKSIPLDLAIAALEVAIAECRKNGKRGSFGVMDMDGQWKVRILDDYTGEVGQHALDHKMYTSLLTQETTYPMIVEAETKEKTRGEIGQQADILDKIAPAAWSRPAATPSRSTASSSASSAPAAPPRATAPARRPNAPKPAANGSKARSTPSRAKASPLPLGRGGAAHLGPLRRKIVVAQARRRGQHQHGGANQA